MVSDTVPTVVNNYPYYVSINCRMSLESRGKDSLETSSKPFKRSCPHTLAFTPNHFISYDDGRKSDPVALGKLYQ
jgi:hypothetical protein